jgi:ComF family protein
VDSRKKMMAFAGAAMDTLLPRHCVMCGCSSGAHNLCWSCFAELPRIGQACLQCGLPLQHTHEQTCKHCLCTPPPWESAIAALLYGFPVDQLVCRFKFGRQLPCGQILGREIALAARKHCLELPDCIVPVPLHRSRLFRRAFNQADVLARQVGKALEIPVRGSVLRRCRRTRAHSGLDAGSRQINIEAAFICNIPAYMAVMYRHVVLLDDVMTTGATLTECTQVLLRAGVKRVSVWVAARAPEPGSEGGVDSGHDKMA